MRAHVYIDGFNLFYGRLKGTPYKWLDLHALCERALPRAEVRRVRYFTAPVSAPPHDPGKPVRQQVYWRALRTVPRISLHFGRFQTHEVDAPLAAAWREGRHEPVRVIKTEEKGTDVNLATHLLLDAFDDLFDMAVVVSNDSDLAEPIRLTRARFGKSIGVLKPYPRISGALRPLAHFVAEIRDGTLARAQFPDRMEDAHGAFHKPGGGRHAW